MPPVGRLPDGARGRLEFVPCGLHVTFLNPDGTGTMVRRKPWAKPDEADPLFAKRKMLGPVGRGAVLLGEWHADAPLYVGEGNETVLSAMALADAPSEAVGIATLSLDNLQGAARKWSGGIWPLFKIEPDPEGKPCFSIPGQRGPVRVLVDSDMAPLKGQKLVERKGGPIIERAITGAERARICAELAVKGWRAIGASDVTALRAPLGMDFNDAILARPPAAEGADRTNVRAARSMPPVGWQQDSIGEEVGHG
jgi:DNA primase